jgi:hypothetical protein
MSSDAIKSDAIPYHICSHRCELKIPYVRIAFVISGLAAFTILACSYYIFNSPYAALQWSCVGVCVLSMFLFVETGRILNHKFHFLTTQPPIIEEK